MPEQLYDTKGNPVSPTIGLYDIHGKPFFTPQNSSGPQPSVGGPTDIGRFTPEALPMLGGAVGSSIPGVGSVGGATLGTIAKQALKNLFPKTFGDPGTGTEQLANAGEDVALQGLLPEGTGKLLTSGIGLAKRIAISKLARQLSPSVDKSLSDHVATEIEKMVHPDTNILETAANNARNTQSQVQQNILSQRSPLNIPSTTKTLPDGIAPVQQNLLDDTNRISFIKDNPGPFSPDNPLRFKNSPRPNTQESLDFSGNGQKISPDPRNAGQAPITEIQKKLLDNPYFDFSVSDSPVKGIATQALSDVNQVRNFKVATGEPYTIEQLALNKLLRGGAKNASKELAGENADIYNEAIRPDTRQNLDKILGKLDSLGGGDTGKYILRYSKARVVLGLGGMATGNPIAMAGSSLILTDAALGKLASSPEATQLFLHGTKTPLSSEQAGLVTKGLLWALRGTTAILRTPDDKDISVKIDQNGNPQEAR